MTTQSRVALLRQANDLLDQYRRETQADLGYWRSAYDDAMTLGRLDDLNDYGELTVSPEEAMAKALEAETGASISDHNGYVWEAFHDEVRDMAERVGVYLDPEDQSHWCEDCGAILDAKRLCPSCLPNSERNEDEVVQ